GEHPIIPVHFRRHGDDAVLAQKVSADLLAEGVYCIGFSFPVVPRGQARIRLQASAAHAPEHVERCIEAFGKVGRRHGVV
ncbi:glycine C-acetyltransferase, partial [bacterium]|nr:glycine C-acetyltransferase [bacterium]